MRSIYADTLPNTAFRFKLPKGKYMGLFVRLSGTNAGGATSAITDCGTLTIIKDGQQKHNIDLDIVQAGLNAQDMGAVENVSAVGAAFTFAFYVPFVDLGDDVCLEVENDFSWEIVLNAPLLVIALVASGVIEFLGYMADPVSVSPYELQYINHHESFSGAGTFTRPVHADNVRRLFIEKDAALSNFAVTKDGLPFVSYQTILNYNALTNLISKTETYAAAIPWIQVDLNPGNDYSGNLSDNVEVTYTTTGACVVRVMVESYFDTPNRFERSAVTRNVALDSKIAVKERTGLPVIAAKLRLDKAEK